MPKRFVCKVEFDIPPGATVAQCRAYVISGVLSECGNLNCYTDPMFYLNRQTVLVYQGGVKEDA